jgi:hypothetical protein
MDHLWSGSKNLNSEKLSTQVSLPVYALTAPGRPLTLLDHIRVLRSYYLRRNTASIIFRLVCVAVDIYPGYSLLEDSSSFF